jgi:hypothetical protein
MVNVKFLGICIVLAAVMVSGALVYHANVTSKIGRYQMLHSPGKIWIYDTETANTESRND